MIQLTKGTNVLDINLSDFSGAGQDVVQNGSFDDIGSDLVQNGDFAQIGSELVTNGDFSAVPLGSELNVFPSSEAGVGNHFRFVDYGNNTIAYDGSGVTTITYVDDDRGGLHYFKDSYNLNTPTLTQGKTYQIKITCKVNLGTYGIQTGSPIGGYNVTGLSNTDYVTHTINAFITDSTSGNWLRIDELSSGQIISINDVSVKEQINLVSNPNFTDTGSDVVINGTFATDTNWSKNSNWTISGGEAISDGTSSATINQSSILTEGVSYKISFEITEYTSGSGYSVRAGAGTTYSTAVTSLGVHTFYQVATGNPLYGDAIYIKASGDTIGKITNVTAEPLGEDWIPLPPDSDAASFTENGLKIVQASDLSNENKVYQPNVTEDNKSYKVTYTIHSAQYTSTNSIQYWNGAGYYDLPEQDVGTHIFYYTRKGTLDNWYFNFRTNTNSATDFVTISSILVQELGEGWTVGNKWSLSNEGARLVSSTSDASGLSQSDVFEIGKSYKVTLDAVVNSGIAKLEKEAGAVQFLIDTTKTYVEYFTATQTKFYLNRYTSVSDIYINNISVKEVGQDWTVQEPDGQSVTFPNSKLSIIYDSTETQGSTGVYQDILTIGKYYKIEIDVASITGDLKLQVGSNSQVINTTGTSYFYTKSDSARIYIVRAQNADSVSGVVNSISIKQLDTNDRWVTFADPDSKSVMKLGQVDLEIDSSGNNCGVYQTGLIKPNKLYIITINMKATAAINVEIAASLGTAVSAVIGTETLTTSYKEYSFEYVTPFAVDHDLQIHRLFGSGASQTISIDYVSMNGVDESQWTNDPTWNPFATSLVFVPTLTDESTNNSKQFTLNTSITDGGWDGRSLHGQVIINEFPTEIPAAGVINLKQPDFLEGFYQVEIRGYLGTFYRVLGKCMAHLERTSTEDGYNRFESYNDTVTYKAYEE